MKVSKEAKIGLFAIIIIAASYTLINFLRGNDFLKKTTNIYSEYENVVGLPPSGPVYIKGFNAGSIIGIKHNKEKDNFIVKLSIKSEFKIPSDSKTVIYSGDILGGKAVRIDLGESDTFISSGDTLQGIIEPDMLTSLIGSITPLSEEIKVLVANLNKTVTSVNEIIDEPLKNDIKGIVSKIENSAENIEYITKKVKTGTPELVEIISNLNSLTLLLNTSAESLNKSLDDVNTITAQVREADIKETINNLKNLLEKIQDPNGSLGKIISSDSLHNSINSLAVDLDSLIKKIEKNPKKYLKLSIL